MTRAMVKCLHCARRRATRLTVCGVWDTHRTTKELMALPLCGFCSNRWEKSNEGDFSVSSTPKQLISFLVWLRLAHDGEEYPRIWVELDRIPDHFKTFLFPNEQKNLSSP